MDKKEKLLNSHLSSVKETKKKDKARQSSSGGSAPGTPVPGERGNISGGSALTPGELKVIDCSYGDLFTIFWLYDKILFLLELTDYSSHFSLSQKSSKERQVVAIKVMVVPTVEIQVEHQLQFLIDLSRY